MTGHQAPSHPLPIAGRLKKRSDYLAVRKGERRKGPFFLLEVLDRHDEAPARVGYTVTKRQGNAVERNRMRRRLKEAVRLKAQFAMKPGHDYVVVARRDALDASFSHLTSVLKDRIESPQRPRRGNAGRESATDAGAGKANRVAEAPPENCRPVRDGRPKNCRPSGITDGQ